MSNKYILLENLSTLLDNGYSLQESLDICRYVCSIEDIEEIQSFLVQGISIEDALLKSKMPLTFKEYFHFLKNKSHLSEAIRKSMNICKMQSDYFDQIKKELTYPLFLILFIFLFSIFVLLILLPKVNELFISFNIQLNIMVKILMFIFYILPFLIVIIVSSFIILIIMLIFSLKRKNIQFIEKITYIPFFKIIIKKYFSLKFAIYYNELLEQNLDNHSIILILNEQLRDIDLKIVLYEIMTRMNNGELIENVLESNVFFEELFLIFFKMNFHHGNKSLSHYINISLQQMTTKIKTYINILTTFIYVFVATFVVMIYLSIIIPMMNIISDI